MTRLSMVSGICVSFVLATALTALAQDERRTEHQGSAQQDRQDQARPTDRPNQERQQMDRQNEPPRSGDRREMTPQNEGHPNPNPQSGDRHMQGREDERRSDQAVPQHQTRSEEQAHAEKSEHNRISNEEFQQHFGREHRFHPGRMQAYSGRQRFYYGGYNFELDQPWPVDWSYDDDCYVDYVDDGYWLFDAEHPSERVALTILP
jgi:type IV secretory pathway VirB10-like protein